MVVKVRMIVACVIMWIGARLGGEEVKLVVVQVMSGVMVGVVVVMSGIMVGVVIVEVGEIMARVARRVMVRFVGRESLVSVVEAVGVVVVAVAFVWVVVVV